MLIGIMQARRASTVTRVIGSSVSTLAGDGPRVSTAESEDASGELSLCLRYVSIPSYRPLVCKSFMFHLLGEIRGRGGI